jgi:hypothetical protein
MVVSNRFGIVHVDGSGENNPSPAMIDALYDELHASADFPDAVVWLENDETGWALSAFPGGKLVLEKSGDQSSSRHMLNADKMLTVSLWKRLASGDHDYVLQLPWKPGYN